MRQGLGVSLLCPEMISRHAANEMIIGVKIFSWLAPGSLYLRLLQFRSHHSDDPCGHLICQIENVFGISVEMICPQIGTCRGVNQLTRNAEAVSGLANAALEKIAHPQFTPDLLYVQSAALICKAGIASDHKQPRKPGQRHGDLFDHAVGEVVLLRISA
jgi:hypothetical protein